MKNILIVARATASKLALMICLQFLLIKSFSQNVHISLAIKKNTSNPVAFATLNFLHEKKQRICDIDGKFDGIVDINDSLLISSVGFVDSILFIRDLLQYPIVMLRQKTSDMKEVVVKTGKRQSIGNIKLREDRSIIGGDSLSPSFEIAKLMKTKGINHEFKILTVSFRQKKYYPTMPLMLRIYAVNKDGLPGEDLLIDSVYMVRQEMYHDDIITIDVRSANIVLNNEDFFVGLLFLHPFNENLIVKNKLGFGNDAGIFETKKEHEILTYRRSNHFNHCWYNEYTTGIIIPKQNQFDEKRGVADFNNSNLKPINLIAGVEIEVLNP